MVKGCQNVFLYKQGMCHICMSPMCIQHKPAHTSPARNDISGGSGQAWLCSQSVRCCCRWGSLRLPLQLQPLQPIRRPFLVLTHPPLATYCPAAWSEDLGGPPPAHLVYSELEKKRETMWFRQIRLAFTCLRKHLLNYSSRSKKTCWLKNKQQKQKTKTYTHTQRKRQTIQFSKRRYTAVAYRNAQKDNKSLLKFKEVEYCQNPVTSFSPESLLWMPDWILNKPELPLNQQQRAVWSLSGTLPEIRAWGMGPVIGVHVLSLWAPVAISIVISRCSPPLYYTRTSVSLQPCSHLSLSPSHMCTNTYSLKDTFVTEKF